MDEHLVCVAERARILISGIQISNLIENRSLGFASLALHGSLKVTIKGPGHIETSSRSKYAIYKSGKIINFVQLLLSRTLDLLDSVVRRKLKNDISERYGRIQDIFNEIIKPIARQGHGGLVLVNDDYNDRHFKTKIASNSTALQYHSCLFWRVADINDSEVKSPVRDGENLLKDANIPSITERLEKCVRAVAQLAGTDGAIALCTDLSIHAFAAIIQTNGIEEKNVKYIDESENRLTLEEIIKNRGSRHQSALDFVVHNPQSFAFVISADGFVTAFHNMGSESVLCEQNLRVYE